MLTSTRGARSSRRPLLRDSRANERTLRSSRTCAITAPDSGVPATVIPRPRRNSSSPSSRSCRSARRTVFVLTPSTAARSRAGGSRSPGLASPSAIARRISAATCSCSPVGSSRSILTPSMVLAIVAPSWRQCYSRKASRVPDFATEPRSRTRGTHPQGTRTAAAPAEGGSASRSRSLSAPVRSATGSIVEAGTAHPPERSQGRLRRPPLRNSGNSS